MRAAHGHLGKGDPRAAQAVLRPGNHIARINRDLGTERLERIDQEIDRARADGAAAGQGDTGLAEAREQRRDHPEARPHARDEVIGRGGIDDGGGLEPQGLARFGALTRAAPHDGVIDTVIAQNPQKQLHIGKARHVREFERLGRQQARRHQGQSRILRAGNRYRAVERRPAADDDAIHTL